MSNKPVSLLRDVQNGAAGMASYEDAQAARQTVSNAYAAGRRVEVRPLWHGPKGSGSWERHYAAANMTQHWAAFAYLYMYAIECDCTIIAT